MAYLGISSGCDGSMVQRVPPSPTASSRPARSGASRRELVELLLAGIAVVLTVAILVSELPGPAASRPADARRPSGAASTTTSDGGGPRSPMPRHGRPAVSFMIRASSLAWVGGASAAGRLAQVGRAKRIVGGQPGVRDLGQPEHDDPRRATLPGRQGVHSHRLDASQPVGHLGPRRLIEESQGARYAADQRCHA